MINIQICVIGASKWSNNYVSRVYKKADRLKKGISQFGQFQFSGKTTSIMEHS